MPRLIFHALPAVAVLALLCAAVIVILARLFWPKDRSEPDASDNWAQRNDLRTPSLERPPEAQDNAVDAAIAAQIIADE